MISAPFCKGSAGKAIAPSAPLMDDSRSRGVWQSFNEQEFLKFVAKEVEIKSRQVV